MPPLRYAVSRPSWPQKSAILGKVHERRIRRQPPSFLKRIGRNMEVRIEQLALLPLGGTSDEQVLQSAE
jgi:hypothetical protein